MNYRLRLHFAKGYIAHPYWPERERLITIQKESGMKRLRSEAKAKQALDTYLRDRGMSMDDYRALEKAADRPFYTANGGSEIIIPAHHLYGCLVQGCDAAPASSRLAKTDQIRTVLTPSDLHTGKQKEDGVWERFVVVTAGTGAKLSNQRALRSNPYIEDFDATGTIEVFGDHDRKKVHDFLAFVGREVGVGASRKLGWGRFTVEELAADA